MVVKKIISFDQIAPFSLPFDAYPLSPLSTRFKKKIEMFLWTVMMMPTLLGFHTPSLCDCVFAVEVL